MLRHLSVRDFALIDRLDLTMEQGFCALTGETGAGKSILLDAVALLAGGRAHQELIRTGADEAVVQGVIDPGTAHQSRVAAALEEAGIPSEDTVVVRRVISRSGGNRVFVNDTLATVGLLQRVVGPLVEIVGQHEQLALTRPETHRRLVDRFAGHAVLLRKMAAAFATWRESLKELARLQAAQAARHDRMDLLRFQRSELEAVAPAASEFEEMERALGRARNQDKLRTAVEVALAALYDGENCASDRLAEADSALSRVADAELSLVAERAREALASVDDAAQMLRGFGAELEEDVDVDSLETRHQEVKAAMRRFGVDAAGIVERLADVKRELHELEHVEEALAAGHAVCEERRASASIAADALDTSRRKAAAKFFKRVLKSLALLGMKDARMALAPARDDRTLTGEGWEPLEVLFSANVGEAPAPIGKVASGGELSRILLSMKTVAADGDPIGTYVFDEVDAGIGGATADVVAEMLQALGGGRQVLCVTHLAQLAGRADTHLHVSKRVTGGRTLSDVACLDDAARVEELARMIGGAELTETTRAHASELLRVR
ncbi:MAG: DNA repair protein RecN (Recombination protein N) [Bradymonadia bacterium]|jgi:DNA repair protein RecN (Recombination protein N)